MTPITLPKSTRIVSTSTLSPTELATQPLLFTPERRCKNKEVMAAITAALADKSRSDQCIAGIFKNAWLNHYQAELNQLITTIETQHGPGTILINSNVVRMLADEQIHLLQNSNGTVQLERSIAVKSDPKRYEVISSTLNEIVPTNLCKLISSYDDEIEFGEKNRKEIITIMECGDASAKSAVMASAAHQRQIRYFNTLFGHKPLNLTGVNLSNLDLTGIILTYAEISFANLQNCCLVDASLSHATFISANLNQANLTRANLANAYLKHSRLIAANLYGANLNGAALAHACLLCANLEQADLGNSMDLNLTALNFSNFKESVYGKTRLPHQTLLKLQKLQAPVDVIVVPAQSLSNFSSDSSSSRQNSLVIYENEQRLLLANGLVMRDHENGTMRLSRALAVHHDPLRSQAIDSTLLKVFPKTMTDLISSYDDDIEICQQNESAILKILKSADQSAKELIIASACRQFKLLYLNQILGNLRHQGFKLDFSRIDLSNLNLTGLNLNNINLSQAVMHGCNLYQVTLHHANLIKTNLNGASLVKTDFSNATMNGARLIQADLTGAILNQVNLVSAVLKFANLLNAELAGGTNLTNAYLDYASMELTNLTGAVMINTSLTHAKMFGARFGGANLTNAKLMRAQLSHCALHSVNLSHADLSEATIDNITLMDEPKLNGTIWTGVGATKIITDPATRKRLPLSIRLQCLE